ncbi:ABC transporter permease subunit [Nitrospirillum sp. BR 11164]|uniref:ABC transporter permease n=1 Tax=Nitrospirillum sp. BR 11164 TaxID=3104324 RepID=UPI002AFFFFC9|nr:ABC transporter permease subunit [Nitrospirillum sp. BR 11164]MEA1653109.1 ABC transporter permease subunit [Nitrospirillum sp. BR 11164]
MTMHVLHGGRDGLGSPSPLARLAPSRWDVVALPLVLGLLALLVFGGHEVAQPLSQLERTPITLDPWTLPYYALRTTLRMMAALGASLLFTLVYAPLAVKSQRAGQILIPALDILQSVPVLTYLSFTVTFFLGLFPGQVVGAELASIFAIFTSQAWNMTFSFYQSLRTVPSDLEEVCTGYHFSTWQRFWRLEVPFAIPGLVWNMMMSMSGGWFFVVAAEAVTVGSTTITLPGVGAYLALAIEQRDLGAIGWVILTMLGVIILYDQLLFRPLVAWADRFRADTVQAEERPTSWVLTMVERSTLFRTLGRPAGGAARATLRWRLPALPRLPAPKLSPRAVRMGDYVWQGALAVMALYVAVHGIQFMATGVTWGDVGHVVLLGLATMGRVVVLIALAAVIWVPIGVMVGMRPRLAAIVQPLAQFLAAFPSNLFFPVAVAAIVHWTLNPDIWLSPLMILGTQWYILFNVVAGSQAYPVDLRDVIANLRLRGWRKWRDALLPGVFPHLVTGAITASGGAWNASIVAEAVSWGDTHVQARGLGAYIAQMTTDADFPRLVLGNVVMVCFVVLFNRLVWRPLYAYAERRLRVS